MRSAQEAGKSPESPLAANAHRIQHARTAAGERAAESPGTRRLPLVTVVILDWNDWRSTLACLDALVNNTYENYSVVIFDNGSVDGSLQRLMEWHARKADVESGLQERIDAVCTVASGSARIAILRNEENEGFTGGMNKAIGFGLKRFSPEFVYLLNNDATIGPDCLRNSIEAAIAGDASIVGSLVKSSDGRKVLFSGGRPWRELFISSVPTGEERLPETWPTGRVEGSGALIRVDFLNELLDQTGQIFDPRFFLYGDDIDLGLRARASGRRIIMSRSAVIYHGLARSMGGEGNPMHYYYITRNRVFLAKRWLPVPLRLLFHIYFPLTRVARAAHRALQGRTRAGAAILEGLRDGYAGRTGKWRHHVA